MTMISRRALTLALAASCLATRPALADKYPTRPIKMIVPLAPGSPVDVVGRLLAQNLSVDLKQNVVVENRPGAGTTIGMKAVATSLAMAPAMLVAQRARVVDLDGALLLARDRPDGLVYEGSLVHPATPALWG